MKKLVLAGAALIAMSLPSFAADLPAKAPILAPAPIFSWTGLYVGGHIGGTWADVTWVNTANTTLFGDLSAGNGFSQSDSAIFGGAHVGYNWQVNNIVFGLEGSISGTGLDAGLRNSIFGAGLDDVFAWNVNWMASFVGRLGLAFNTSLIYVKGGWVGADSELSVVDTVPANIGAGSSSEWHNGWTVGVGWEYAFTRNWIAGIEYNYYSFDLQVARLAGAAVPAVYNFNYDLNEIHSVVGRISYKF